jgi:hypothetical protein
MLLCKFGLILYLKSNKLLYEDAVFWVVTPCSLVEVYQRFICPDDGGSKEL